MNTHEIMMDAFADELEKLAGAFKAMMGLRGPIGEVGRSILGFKAGVKPTIKQLLGSRQTFRQMAQLQPETFGSSYLGLGKAKSLPIRKGGPSPVIPKGGTAVVTPTPMTPPPAAQSLKNAPTAVGGKGGRPVSLPQRVQEVSPRREETPLPTGRRGWELSAREMRENPLLSRFESPHQLIEAVRAHPSRYRVHFT